MTKEKLLIVGGGIASVACVEEILKYNPERFDITILAAEPHLNYNRVLLSEVLRGEKGIEDIYLHDRGWYEKKGVKLHTACSGAAIKRKSRIVVSESGLEFPYNKLILATGSSAIIPPIKGSNLDGVVTFRDLRDCERIKAIAGIVKSTVNADDKLKKAVVIGGGLLGLEAAYSLSCLGFDVSVAHLMDRLMERQLDTACAAFLKDDLERLGIKVLLNKETAELAGKEAVERVRFKDGEELEADLVLLSTGVKPNAELAKISGIYCERGVVVSDTMQTFDPSVYAVGECIQHRGATFGLVYSVFEQARVLANHLAGDSRLVFKNMPSSTRLKVPGIDLYSSGEMEPDAETIEYTDKSAGVYKKLFIKDRELRGIILYGDSLDGPRLFDSLVKKEDISGKRASLLLGDGVSRGDKGSSIAEMPDDAVVCGCNGVTKGAIVDAIKKKGLFTRDDVKRETKASDSCGGCSATVERLLDATLGMNLQRSLGPEGICPCTIYSREDIIKNIREKGLKSVNDVMTTLGWESIGCEECRPAVNYYIKMVWPADAVDDPSSRLINERVHANIQKDNTFSVIPRVYGGAIRPEELRRIADVAEKFKAPLVKITGGQRIGIFGIKKEDLPNAWRDIDMPSGFAYGKALRTVKTCVGSEHCRYGTQDSLGLGIALERKLEGLWMPAKVKLGVSGCPRNCAEAGIKDIGISGVSGEWKILAGGCGGIEEKSARLLASVKTGEEVLEITCALIQLYREDAHYGERTFKWMERAGQDSIKKAVVENRENRERLLSNLGDALRGVTAPWPLADVTLARG